MKILFITLNLLAPVILWWPATIAYTQSWYVPAILIALGIVTSLMSLFVLFTKSYKELSMYQKLTASYSSVASVGVFCLIAVAF